MKLSGTGALAFTLALAGAMSAAEAADPATPAPHSMASQFDVAFGVGVTTDYVARGISQTGNGAAVQGFVEFDVGQLYAGAWTSNVSLAGVSDQEVDLAVGWRPEFNKFSLDFGYVQYVYLNNVMGTSYGELYAGAMYAVNDRFSLGAKVNFAPNYANTGTVATYVEGTADLKLPKNFGISGGVGYQSFASVPSYVTGNIGVYWNLNQAVKLDLRASATSLSASDCALVTTVSNVCGAKVLLSLSVATSVRQLSNKN